MTEFDLPADHRHQHLGRLELRRVDDERILAEHDEIGVLANLQRAHLAITVKGVGRSEGHQPKRFVDVIVPAAKSGPGRQSPSTRVTKPARLAPSVAGSAG